MKPNTNTSHNKVRELGPVNTGNPEQAESHNWGLRNDGLRTPDTQHPLGRGHGFNLRPVVKLALNQVAQD
jgi:hypothetical protein